MELGCGKYLTAVNFKGRVFVHVRQYDIAKHEVRYPTKRGICMSATRFASLVQKLGEIDKAYKEIKEEECFIDIGGKLYVMIKPGYNCVSLRHVFKKDGKLLASKFGGIALTGPEWKNLVHQAPMS